MKLKLRKKFTIFSSQYETHKSKSFLNCIIGLKVRACKMREHGWNLPPYVVFATKDEVDHNLWGVYQEDLQLCLVVDFTGVESNRPCPKADSVYKLNSPLFVCLSPPKAYF